MEQRSQWYQTLLIFSLVGVAALIGVFVYREVFPEYKLYQNTYEELEQFRSTYTGEPPPPFRGGVRQLVLAKEDKGPETIDRCISCHVALDLEHFSPTVVAKDVNGNVRLDDHGKPLLEENKNYVWKKLNDKIISLREDGLDDEANRLESLKHVTVGHHHYDVTKVLKMHPLIGGELRPFELHSIEEVGCTSCHGGNGRGLATDRAHGPIFDGHYHAEAHGPAPEFLEKDPDNDPNFSRVFNHKPGHRLLFQTTPLLVGGLIEANCMQCHQSTQEQVGGAAISLEALRNRKNKEIEIIEKSITDDKRALATLTAIASALQTNSIAELKEDLSQKLGDYRLNDQEQAIIESQIKYLSKYLDQSEAITAIRSDATNILGSQELAEQLFKSSNGSIESIEQFISQQSSNSSDKGTVFAKMQSVRAYEDIKQRLTNVEGSVAETAEDGRLLNGLSSELDVATHHFHRGSELFISQACYACHRIAGYSRGGIGPELTEEGKSYPWFIKESITWPQADLKTSTMPNFHLDHDEVEDLVSFLLAQKGERKAVSEFDRKTSIANWEAGARLPIEQPVAPNKIYDVHNSMKIFANEGCASCHRLTGFESDVGYRVEKEGGDWDKVYQASQRFKELFPEDIIGSQLTTVIKANEQEIDQLIVPDVRKNSIIEELEESDPEAIEAFYSNFKYALRARNKEFSDEIAAAPSEKERIITEQKAYLDRVRLVLKVYVQEYGLGRLIAPRVNWSGLYRDDEWLIAHFKNPAAHSPKSIMPVFPYDDTKFYALTHMLNVLAEKNRDKVREIWSNEGFSPEQAYDIHCANCHGQYLHGNGPTAEWIYPIPKNLRNAYFLRNLTKERAINSIVHGVKGGPMPPWGEVAPNKNFSKDIPVLTKIEIDEIVNWLFNSLPGSQVVRDQKDVPKWNYQAEDVLEELDDAGEQLRSADDEKSRVVGGTDPELKALLGSLIPKKINDYYVDLEPRVYLPRENSKPKASVEDVFDIVQTAEGDQFYIKKKFYTPENIRAGHDLFTFHCSVCHGDEGAGNGLRSEAMIDAKPRMLTNLDWLKSRDDLRLLRSIKYGVRGTSMTPWGDYTSSLQRMQLVIFIRSLTAEKDLREVINTAIFESFERPLLVIGQVRGENYKKLESAQKKYLAARESRRQEFEQVQQAAGAREAVVEQYGQELQLLENVQQYEAIDALLDTLIKELEVEGEIYQIIGVNLVERGATEGNYSSFSKAFSSSQSSIYNREWTAII